MQREMLQNCVVPVQCVAFLRNRKLSSLIKLCDSKALQLQCINRRKKYPTTSKTARNLIRMISKTTNSIRKQCYHLFTDSVSPQIGFFSPHDKLQTVQGMKLSVTHLFNHLIASRFFPSIFTHSTGETYAGVLKLCGLFSLVGHHPMQPSIKCPSVSCRSEEEVIFSQISLSVLQRTYVFSFQVTIAFEKTE